MPPQMILLAAKFVLKDKRARKLLTSALKNPNGKAAAGLSELLKTIPGFTTFGVDNNGNMKGGVSAADVSAISKAMQGSNISFDDAYQMTKTPVGEQVAYGIFGEAIPTALRGLGGYYSIRGDMLANMLNAATKEDKYGNFDIINARLQQTAARALATAANREQLLNKGADVIGNISKKVLRDNDLARREAINLSQDSRMPASQYQYLNARQRTFDNANSDAGKK